MAIPVFIILIVFLKSDYLAFAWAILQAAFGFLTRCSNCGYGVYYESNAPYKTIFARPHEYCTKCGKKFD
jgi:hypothetical protein